MAIGFYFLLVLTILILPIKCNSDFFSISNSENGHLHESPAYKYSQQGNIKQFINMSHFTLFNNNIFLSIISINIIPIILLFVLIPITILRRYQFLLTIFMSFTSGGLMADVFLRLLPFIILSYNNNSIETQSQSHVHHQHDNRAGLFILMGIFFSFIIEKFLRYLQNDDEQTDSPNVLAYLFLSADVLHNYTNSLILSSIFTMKSTVIITKIIYEVLHVFYGYTILIYSGWSSAKAMRYQLLTGLCSSIVCLIVLQIQSNLTAQLWSNQIFLPIISGIFVYISTVHLIPEVMESNYGIKGTIFKVTAFIISGYIIFYLKKYE